jgi:hypothetical protein
VRCSLALASSIRFASLGNGQKLTGPICISLPIPAEGIKHTWYGAFFRPSLRFTLFLLLILMLRPRTSPPTRVAPPMLHFTAVKAAGANEARLWSVIDLGNLWRRLALPKAIGNWSLTSLQQRLVKTGGRLIKHVRYYWLLLAESHLTRRLFGGTLRRITTVASPAG